jgi:hypothetical protein
MTTRGRRRLATALVGAAVAAYAWHRAAPDALVLGSTRGAAVVVLALGLTACAVGGSYVLHRRYERFMSSAGVATLVLTLLAVSTGAERWLSAQVTLVVSLWVIATAHRALAGGHVVEVRGHLVP